MSYGGHTLWFLCSRTLPIVLFFQTLCSIYIPWTFVINTIETPSQVLFFHGSIFWNIKFNSLLVESEFLVVWTVWLDEKPRCLIVVTLFPGFWCLQRYWGSCIAHKGQTNRWKPQVISQPHLSTYIWSFLYYHYDTICDMPRSISWGRDSPLKRLSPTCILLNVSIQSLSPINLSCDQVEMWWVFTGTHWTCKWEGKASSSNHSWRHKAASGREISLLDLGSQSIRLDSWSWAEINSPAHPSTSGSRVAGLILNLKMVMFLYILTVL